MTTLWKKTIPRKLTMTKYSSLRQSKKLRRSLGLTLVELLIVISIIMILAGLILYVGTKLRERAHSVQDMVNSRGGE